MTGRGPALAIVGTDTNVGKTVVTAALVLALRRAGVDALPWKPVASGGVKHGGRLVSADALWWRKVLGLPQDPRLLNPICYRAPLAPWIASGGAGPSNAELALALKSTAGQGPVLVEGVGGALVPLRRNLSFAGWMRTLGFPAVIVGRAGLGTINHVLLTVEALRARKIPVRGIILNGARGRDRSERTNPRAVTGLCGVPVLAVLPWLPGVVANPRTLAALSLRLPGARIKRMLG